MGRLTERTDLGSLILKGDVSTRQLIDKCGKYEELEEFLINTKAVYQRKVIRLEKNEKDTRIVLDEELDREDVKEDLANIIKLLDRYNTLLDFIDDIEKRI